MSNLLPAMLEVRPDLDVRLFTDTPVTPGRPARAPVPQVVGPTRGYRWQLWERFVLPWHASLVHADVLHSPANTTPLRSAMPRVVTVHDVIPYLPAVAPSTISGHYWRRTVPEAVRRAAAVVTDSETSRIDIARVFEIPPERIDVVPLAVGADVQKPTGDLDSWLHARRLHRPYVLALAATAPRKNTIGVLRVFQRIARQNPDAHLVLTGVGHGLRSEIARALTTLEIPASRVKLLGFVAAEDRNALYAGAAVFLFLTLYEGFGLPILEAMRCGAPVLCSNRSSCPEVAGDAAALVDPADEEIAARIALDLMALSAADRRRWQVRGFQRERQFSWKNTARRTLDVYDRVSA
jgi:glycosyltransferase involved in cell wall biosynthesis